MKLADADLSLRVEPDDYRRRLVSCQLTMRRLARRLYDEQRSLVVVVEGWDAAGKGGAIRRLTGKLDPRGYRVFPIAAPGPEARERHYLWRFWRRLEPPRDRQISIFDRSWYGRVLVERVEGFARRTEWQRAYDEINAFERQLTEHGTVLAKLWFHLSPDEQLRRFEQRRDTPHKAWKLTDEDWRNRERWDDYVQAVDEMLARTHAEDAPWIIVEGDDKYHARLRTLDVLAARLDRALR